MAKMAAFDDVAAKLREAPAGTSSCVGEYEWPGGLYGTTYTTDRNFGITAHNGQLLTLPGGAPAVSDLDLLYFDVNGVASISSVSSSAGASWTLAGAGISWLAKRTATGSEPATVTVVANAQVPIRVRWLRWH